jgi:hypothetical protein
VFDEADGPERGHGEESGDSPALSSERRPACSHFATDEAEEGWGDESDQEDEEEDRFEDENEGTAGVPARIEWKEGADAVVVGPVEQEMTEQGNEREAVEQAPADGGAGRLAGGGSTGTPAVEEPDRTDDDGSLEWEAEEGVGPPTMMLKGRDGTVDGPEDVEVGDFGSECHGDGGVGCLAVEPGAGEADSGHQVGYGFHRVRVSFLEFIKGIALGRAADDKLAAGDAIGGSELRSVRYWLTPSTKQACRPNHAVGREFLVRFRCRP